MPLRTIHVGVGGRGTWPVELMTDDRRFRPVALVDIVPIHLAAAQKRSGLDSRACFSSLDTALRTVDADALVICTPTTTHARLCRAGFAAGKHVLVEKGMTLDLEEARALVAEAASARVRFCVSQNYRYREDVRTLARLLPTGDYGTVHLIDLTHHRHRPEPRTLDYPGAVVWDMGCHHFDNLVYLFGPAARAIAMTHNAPWSAYTYPAGITAAIEFASGPVCSFVLTHQATVQEYRWVLQSERGMLRTDGRSAWKWTPRGAIQQFAAAGTTTEIPLVKRGRSEQGVIDDWLVWINGGEEPGISGRRNLETLALCELVLRAASERRSIERAELD
jgi:predicted dehydrogenase